MQKNSVLNKKVSTQMQKKQRTKSKYLNKKVNHKIKTA